MANKMAIRLIGLAFVLGTLSSTGVLLFLLPGNQSVLVGMAIGASTTLFWLVILFRWARRRNIGHTDSDRLGKPSAR